MENKELEVIFYLTSGETFDCLIDESTWHYMREELKKDWSALVITGEKYGINFTHVTHYQLKTNV